MTAIHFHQIPSSLSLFYTESDQFDDNNIVDTVGYSDFGIYFEYGYTYITFFFFANIVIL